MFPFITFHLHREKLFEGTAFLGGTSPKFKKKNFKLYGPFLWMGSPQFFMIVSPQTFSILRNI